MSKRQPYDAATPFYPAMKLAFIAEIDAEELALRLTEIGCGIRRTNNKTTREVLDKIESAWPPGAGPFPFRTMARKALEYFQECIERGQRPS